ncbi:MAG: hypothetical protein U0L17_03845 [Acutalibacteraceae bacterium]|nr:hypothetical protein [Acutalibacteraceae bacterium]
MKFLKKSFCAVFSVLLCFCVVSCKSSNNFYTNTDNYYTEDGELTISPYFAYYNDGKEVKELEEIDPEMAEEGVSDDGAFNIYFALCNNSPYDRKINEIKVDYIKNADDYDIVESSEFTLDNEVYLSSGETKIVPCVFEKDFVKLVAKLDDLSVKASVVYEGCVVNGAEPETKANTLTASVKELKFTSSDGIEGSFIIKNNFSKEKNVGQIAFMLYTDGGEKITKNPVKMQVDSTVEPSETITLKFAVLPANVSDDIKENKLFDSVEIKISEE